MAIHRRVLFNKLNATLFQALEQASAFCRRHNNPYIELAHWLYALTRQADCDFMRITRHFGLPDDTLANELTLAIQNLPQGASAISDFSHHIDIAVERAWMLTSLHTKATHIRSSYLLVALIETPELRQLLLNTLPSFSAFPKVGLLDLLPGIIAASPESVDDHIDALTNTTPAAHADTTKASPLEQYCTDLTQLAKDGKIDPVIGREHEIRTMTDILLRRRQNNPLLTGEAGVGKTAVVEGLAHAIHQGLVPPALQNTRLLSLDMGALLAGASMKGEFEARLKSVLEAATQADPAVILFIDEVHTMVGAGGQEGTGDAANLLKPALARGALRTIGATTWREYKRYIEKDPALTRRFQVLQVMEPEEASAIKMVRGIADTFSVHHQVWIMDDAITAAVTLSHRYIPERQLPDKAISLLDTACARVALSMHTPPAALVVLTESLASLQVEFDLLQKEQTITGQQEERLAQLTQMINDKNASRETIALQWEKESALITRIIKSRQDVLAAETEEEQQTLSQTLTTLSSELQALQQGAGLVCAQVDAGMVAEIVSNWTGIPVGRMLKDGITAIQQLSQTLQQRVVGQPHALTRIAECIQTSRAQLTDPNKPAGVFLLVGPSGVGKTETALTLANTLFGGEQNLITINMSEFQETHTISTLKGAPPGYVGYGEGGVLTEAVRRRPYSVVLLDEIEKAHPDVFELFYQVFDKGWMEDGEGRYIDFKNTIILLTSNACSDIISQLCEDEDTPPTVAQLETMLLDKLTATFPTAFLGRLTIVPYLPLQDDALASILRLHLNKVVERMHQHHGITLTITDAVIAHIIQTCKKQLTGARHFIQFIERHILPRLSVEWMQSIEEKTPIETITIDVNAEDVLTFSITHHTTF